MQATRTELDEFQSLIDRGGLDAALAYLNRRTDFRYTAIYRLQDGMMCNISLFDRRSEDTSQLAEVPLGESFCQFVMADGGFQTADSATDDRLDGHVYKGILNSYYGLPLSSEPGTIYGTLCHFDFDPRQIADSEVPFLESVRPLLMSRLAGTTAF
jgi:hypothetical protein